MKLVYALLPALALANPLLITIDTGSSGQSGPSILARTCDQDHNFCGATLMEWGKPRGRF